MIGRAMEILKNNRILVLLYMSVMIANICLMWATELLGDFTNKDPMKVALNLVALIGVSVVISVFSLIFFSGFGKMLAEAVETGTTSIHSFWLGIKQYIGKLFLIGLILVGVYFAFAIIIGSIVAIVMIVFGAASSVNGGGYDPTLTKYIGIGFGVLIGLLIASVVPFVILTFPALFFENLGIMASIKQGAKAGLKNYWKLLGIVLATYFPTLIYSMATWKSQNKGIVFTPEYMGFSIVNAVIGLLFLTLIFVMYRDWLLQNSKVESMMQMEFFKES